MKNTLLIIVGTMFIAMMATAQAQPRQVICIPGTNANTGNNTCFDVTATNPLPVTSSGSGTGNVNITQVGGNAVTTTVPVSGTVTTTPSGTQNVTGAGTAGTPATGVVTVQGISGGTDQAISIDQTTPGTTNGVVVNPTSVSGAAIIPVVTQGASTLLGKASPGNLYTAYLTATADSWLMIFNATSAPTNGATTAGTGSGNLQDCVKVPSGTTTSIGGLALPERFSVGVYFAISSTACASLTLATTGLIHGMVQ